MSRKQEDEGKEEACCRGCGVKGNQILARVSLRFRAAWELRWSAPDEMYLDVGVAFPKMWRI